MLAVTDFRMATIEAWLTLTILGIRGFDREFLLLYLQNHPHLRDIIIGAGSALDPHPKCYKQTFITDDHLALLSDWMATGRGLAEAMKAADDRIIAVEPGRAALKQAG